MIILIKFSMSKRAHKYEGVWVILQKALIVCIFNWFTLSLFESAHAVIFIDSVFMK